MEFGGNSNNLKVSHVFKSYEAFSEGLKGTKLEGVTSPYIYVGTWKAMFGWHKEDMDLYSINSVHTGQPKFWYGVDLDSSGDFERYVHRNFREQVKSCSEFIRHKTTLIHPDNLLKNGVKLTRAIQRPGEFVISRAAAYHSGFNAGYNIAEAVNFALPAWVDVAEEAKSCQCVRDSVRIDMRAFKSAIGMPVSELPEKSSV